MIKWGIVEEVNIFMNDGKENQKQKNAGNPIFILIIFAVLIGFIFFIPEIYKKYNKDLYKFFKGEPTKEENKADENEDKSPKSAYYQLGQKSTLKFNEIELSDITLSEDRKTLSFTINADETIDLDSLDYYVEFYEARKTFLGRRALHGEFSKRMIVDLDVSALDLMTTNYMTISLITEDGVPSLESPSDESGLSLIECKKENETYQYEFYLKKLTKVIYKYSYTDSNIDTLSSKLLEAQKKEKTYNEYTGVTAHIAENTNSFVFMSEFDYENVNSFKKIGDNRIYDKSTLNSVVKFKMDAEGFECK